MIPLRTQLCVLGGGGGEDGTPVPSPRRPHLFCPSSHPPGPALPQKRKRGQMQRVTVRQQVPGLSCYCRDLEFLSPCHRGGVMIEIRTIILYKYR